MDAYSDRIRTLQPSAIREILKFTSYPDVISFAGGNPAPEAFPVKEIKEIMNDIMEHEPVTALQYSVSEGYTPLRDTIKDDLYAKGILNWNNDTQLVPFWWYKLNKDPYYQDLLKQRWAQCRRANMR